MVKNLNYENDKKKILYARKLIKEYFKGNPIKTDLWFNMKNPILGDISPNDMIRFGRINKLILWIESALEENKREKINEAGNSEK